MERESLKKYRLFVHPVGGNGEFCTIYSRLLIAGTHDTRLPNKNYSFKKTLYAYVARYIAYPLAYSPVKIPFSYSQYDCL